MMRAELRPAHLVVRQALFRITARRRLLRALAMLRHHGWKLAAVAVLFCIASTLQYREEAEQERQRADAAEVTLAAYKAFAAVPEVTFVVRAKSFEDARHQFKSIEAAALKKQGDFMGAQQLQIPSPQR